MWAKVVDRIYKDSEGKIAYHLRLMTILWGGAANPELIRSVRRIFEKTMENGHAEARLGLL